MLQLSHSAMIVNSAEGSEVCWPTGGLGWGLNTPSCSSALRSAQRSVVRVRGKSTLLKENFVCALLLSSVAQSVDSESCMESLVIVGN